MPWLEEVIENWKDNDNYPPKFYTLPSHLVLPSDLIVVVTDCLRQSVAEKKEFGARIGFGSRPAMRLILGPRVRGHKNHVDIPIVYEIPGAQPVGAFHTHPRDKHHIGPSFGDIFGLYADFRKDGEILDLVVSLPVENPTLYLLIATKDTLLFHINEKTFYRKSRDYRASQVDAVKESIKKEISPFTMDFSISREVYKNIAHERTLIQQLRQLNIGFYSGQNGILTLRN